MRKSLQIPILPQPTDITCGPTCLQAIYRYYEDSIPLTQLIQEVISLEEGGTLAVLLAIHALKRGYKAVIYTYNLQVFDPTWFDADGYAIKDLPARLQAQAEFKQKSKLSFATEGYLELLKLGGEIRFKDLNRNLLTKYLKKKIPILTGLSSTFLYHSCREIGDPIVDDDIKGVPQGHFVVLSGYDAKKGEIEVADPYQRNPYSKDLKYSISADRVVCSIMLGILTYDANFLIILPTTTKKK